MIFTFFPLVHYLHFWLDEIDVFISTFFLKSVIAYISSFYSNEKKIEVIREVLEPIDADYLYCI